MFEQFRSIELGESKKKKKEKEKEKGKTTQRIVAGTMAGVLSVGAVEQTVMAEDKISENNTLKPLEENTTVNYADEHRQRLEAKLGGKIISPEIVEAVQNSQEKVVEVDTSQKIEAERKLYEEALKLPSKIITEDDFPLSMEKYAALLDEINQTSRLNTASSSLRGEFVPGHDLISISQREFKTIFFSPAFDEVLKSQIGKMSFMNAISLAQAIYRLLENSDQETSVNDDMIKEAAFSIVNSIEKVKHHELFGPDTKLILCAYGSSQFSNSAIIEKLHLAAGGSPEDVLCDVTGMLKKDTEGIKQLVDEWHTQNPGYPEKPEYLQKLLGEDNEHNLTKIMTLYSIACSQLPTTIVFSGHGLPDGWYLVDPNKTSDVPSEGKILVHELGDALKESNNISNINIVGASCYSYDFLVRVFQWLDQHGVAEHPWVTITVSNRNRPGYAESENNPNNEINDYFLEQLSHAPRRNGQRNIRVADFFLEEGNVFRYEDPAIIIGSPRSKLGSKFQSNWKPADNPNDERSVLPKGYLELGGKENINDQQLFA